MSLINQYMFGNRAGGVTGNLAAFGGNFSSNPLSVQGLMGLYGPGMMSADAASRGGHNIAMTQMAEIARMMNLTKNGKVQSCTAFQLLSDTMGVGADSARAMIELQRSLQDPRTGGHMMGAIGANVTRQQMAAIAQDDLDNGSLNGIIRWGRNAWKNIQQGSLAAQDPLMGAHANLVDDVKNFYYKNGDSPHVNREVHLLMMNWQVQLIGPMVMQGMVLMST
jgi:hypothetical protein